jgi:hypothetical protein
VETQLDKQVKLVQAKYPGWEYERCAFLVVEAKSKHEHAGQDPQIQTELGKLGPMTE